MSWSVTVMRFSKPLRRVQEAHGVPQLPLGAHADVQSAVSAVFPGTDWSDPGWGVWKADSGTVEFELGREDPSEGMRILVRAQPEVMDRIARLLRGNGWQGFDSPMGEFVDVRADATSGLEAAAGRRMTAIEGSYDPADPAQFARWRDELLRTGRALGDEVGAEAAQDRYLTLVDAVDGSEGHEVLVALIDSMQLEEDNEVYEATINAAWSFSAQPFAAGIVEALPALLEVSEDLGGRLLCGISGEYLRRFNSELANAPQAARERIMDFVLRNEAEGWFEEMAGKIRPA